GQLRSQRGAGEDVARVLDEYVNIISNIYFIIKMYWNYFFIPNIFIIKNYFNTIDLFLLFYIIFYQLFLSYFTLILDIKSKSEIFNLYLYLTKSISQHMK
ncbi:hypothetical protein ACJX0J_015771, partial [Zea mays]